MYAPGAIAARRRLAIPIEQGARARLRNLIEPEPGDPPANPPPTARPEPTDDRDERPVDPPANHRSRILRLELGVKADGTALVWDSSLELNSFVIGVGSSGSGKTEMLKLYAQAARKASIPVILVDVHGDLKAPRLTDYRIGEEYSLNPMDGPAAVPDRAAWITAPIKEAAKLGHVQSHALTLAVTDTLKQAQLTHKRPTLAGLKEAVRNSQSGNRASIDGLSAVLDQLFEPSAFAGRELPIANLLCFGGHLNLTALSTRAQLLVVQSLLAQTWGALVAQGLVQPGRLRALLVLDEGARLKGSLLLDRVMRELRKFGLGICVASQLPENLSEEVRGNAGTAFVLPLAGQLAQRQAAELLGGSATRRQVAELARPGEAWVRSAEGITKVQLHQPGAK